MAPKKKAIPPSNLTAEHQQLLEELETRKAELTLLKSIQEGLASGLDINAIFELAGERIAEIFPGEGIALYTYDPTTHMGEAKFILEDGVRFYPPPFQAGPIGRKAAETKKPLILSSRAEFEALGTITIEGTAPSLSGMYIPLIVHDTPVGAMNIESTSQEHAFNDSDLRLAETIASSLSIALENARLLKETEERNAELAIINTVQRALSAQLDIRGIYQAVGEKLREIFDSQTIAIYSADLKQRIITTEYAFEKGQRFEPVSQPFSALHDHLTLLNDTYVFNGDFPEFAAQFDDYRVSAGEMPKSLVGVPVRRISESDTIVTLTLQDIDGGKTFSESDIRLLETLANSMSVALENARLFDETQRLLKETEQRAAEFATLNAVSLALIAESDLDALIKLIGEQMRQTFMADIVYVALLDPSTRMIQFHYTYGERFDPLPLGEGLTSKIIQTGKPLLINREMDKRRAEMGVTQVGVSARSYLGVPIQRGGQTFGVISVQSTQAEGLFNESDLRLLRTIAANVSTAIRNVQLFDEIKRQKQYYETVIENSPAAIVVLDQKAAVTGWNPAAEKLFGYTEAEALGENIDDLVARADNLHTEAVRYSQKALEEKQVHLLAQRTRRDGSLVDVEVSGVPIQIEGQQGDYLAIYHDVTELQRAREAAEQANQAKSAFLANMSHELRTPLNAILGFTRIVKRKGAEVLPEKQIENLDKVLVSADHLLGLINSVLDISKIEAGRMDIKASAFDLPSLIQWVVDTSQPLMREGVTLETDLPAEFPVVLTDQDKLKQILINLLSNAAKFTHEGMITLAARQDGQMLYVDVSDTGIGFPEEALGRIFEEFQQVDTSITREYGGTGLGLTISRRLARLLGGDLNACSIEGEGSTFTLTLPLRYEVSPLDDVLDQVRPGEDHAPTGQPIILAIDDDPIVHDLLKENLGERGYQVIGVCSGDEGLSLAHELKPFAITLDIMMPEKDGWQVLHELKDDPATREIPVILITIVDKQTLGYQLGASDYLVKPLDEEAVLAALQHIHAHKQRKSHVHVLVVDDDPNIPEMVSQLLEASSYRIESAPDGQAALEAIRSKPPDVILLDLMMPHMDGFAFIESLRAEDLHIPIIVLSAKTPSKAELEILQDSVAQIIQKNGLDQEQLLAQLQGTIENLRERATRD